MHLMQHDKHSRRAFLRRSGHLALMGAAAPLGLNLAAMGEAAAFNANDYKALVCVFLFGGNDHANTVVAYDNASHAAYARIRAAGAGTAAGSIALQRAALDATRLQPLAPASALIELVHYSFLLDVGDRDRHSLQLRHTAALAAACPVLRLDYPRRYEDLARVQQAILACAGGAAAAGGGGQASASSTSTSATPPHPA